MTGIDVNGRYGFGAHPSFGGSGTGQGASMGQSPGLHAPRRVGVPPQPPGQPAAQHPQYAQHTQPMQPAHHGYAQPAAAGQAAYGAHPGYAQPAAAPQPGYGAYQAPPQTGHGGYADPGYGAPHDYSAYATDPADEDGAGTPTVNWIGALCSLAILLGLGYWGYTTIQRDVSGVPVIQALPGPMRIQPEDPGGAQASHQGLAVNEVQAEGRAAGPPDQIVLAPQPLDLSTEGMSVATLPPAGTTQNGSSVALTPTPELTDTEAAAAYAALADQLAQGTAPLDGAGPMATAPTPDGGSVTLRVLPAGAPGLARSPRPPARPASFATVAATAAVVPAVASRAAPVAQGPFVDPASIATGTRMVQFGAFDSPEIARSEWQRLSGRFAQFMDGKRPVVQQAFSGGREFHRLRLMGFDTLSEAQRFCSVFQAENTPCIPVVAK